MKTRGDEIFAAFKRFHRDNPGTWLAFVNLANRLWDMGHKKYSVRAIFYVLQYHADTHVGHQVKINKYFTPYYARMYRLEFPEKRKLFSLSKLKSHNKPATGLPVNEDAWVGPPMWDDSFLDKELLLLLPTPGDVNYSNL